jgi:hypothetical protein
MQWDTIGCSGILLDAVGYYWMQWDTIGCSGILLDAVPS